MKIILTLFFIFAGDGYISYLGVTVLIMAPKYKRSKSKKVQKGSKLHNKKLQEVKDNCPKLHTLFPRVSIVRLNDDLLVDKKNISSDKSCQITSPIEEICSADVACYKSSASENSKSLLCTNKSHDLQSIIEVTSDSRRASSTIEDSEAICDTTVTLSESEPECYQNINLGANQKSDTVDVIDDEESSKSFLSETNSLSNLKSIEEVVSENNSRDMEEKDPDSHVTCNPLEDAKLDCGNSPSAPTGHLDCVEQVLERDSQSSLSRQSNLKCAEIIGEVDSSCNDAGSTNLDCDKPAVLTSDSQNIQARCPGNADVASRDDGLGNLKDDYVSSEKFTDPYPHDFSSVTSDVFKVLPISNEIKAPSVEIASESASIDFSCQTISEANQSTAVHPAEKTACIESNVSQDKKPLNANENICVNTSEQVLQEDILFPEVTDVSSEISKSEKDEISPILLNETDHHSESSPHSFVSNTCDASSVTSVCDGNESPRKSCSELDSLISIEKRCDVAGDASLNSEIDTFVQQPSTEKQYDELDKGAPLEKQCDELDHEAIPKKQYDELDKGAPLEKQRNELDDEAVPEKEYNELDKGDSLVKQHDQLAKGVPLEKQCDDLDDEAIPEKQCDELGSMTSLEDIKSDDPTEFSRSKQCDDASIQEKSNDSAISAHIEEVCDFDHVESPKRRCDDLIGAHVEKDSDGSPVHEASLQKTCDGGAVQLNHCLHTGTANVKETPNIIEPNSKVGEVPTTIPMMENRLCSEKKTIESLEMVEVEKKENTVFEEHKNSVDFFLHEVSKSETQEENCKSSGFGETDCDAHYENTLVSNSLGNCSVALQIKDVSISAETQEIVEKQSHGSEECMKNKITSPYSSVPLGDKELQESSHCDSKSQIESQQPAKPGDSASAGNLDTILENTSPQNASQDGTDMDCFSINTSNNDCPLETGIIGTEDKSSEEVKETATTRIGDDGNSTFLSFSSSSTDVNKGVTSDISNTGKKLNTFENAPEPQVDVNLQEVVTGLPADNSSPCVIVNTGKDDHEENGTLISSIPEKASSGQNSRYKLPRVVFENDQSEDSISSHSNNESSLSKPAENNADSASTSCSEADVLNNSLDPLDYGVSDNSNATVVDTNSKESNVNIDTKSVNIVLYDESDDELSSSEFPSSNLLPVKSEANSKNSDKVLIDASPNSNSVKSEGANEIKDEVTIQSKWEKEELDEMQKSNENIDSDNVVSCVIDSYIVWY